MRIQQQQISIQQGMQAPLQGQQNQGFNQQVNITQNSNEGLSMQWTSVDPNNPAHQAFIKKWTNDIHYHPFLITSKLRFLSSSV